MEAVLEMEMPMTLAKAPAAKRKSLFITFEGGEGAGKSTQAEALYQKLKKMGFWITITKEPYRIKTRQALFSPEKSLSAEEELELFTKDREYHVRTAIKPTLNAGYTVISDRFGDSTIAYQHFGRGLPLEMVKKKDEAARQGLTPNLTVLLDIDPKIGLARKMEENIPLTRFEEEKFEFHEQVRNGFLQLAYAEPERFMIIDAAQPAESIKRKILSEVLKLL